MLAQLVNRAQNPAVQQPLTELDSNSPQLLNPTKAAAATSNEIGDVPATADEVLNVLSSLQHVGADTAMAMLDALATCETAMNSLVRDAQAGVAQAKAERAAEREAAELAACNERLIRRRRKNDMETSRSASGEEDSTDDASQSALQSAAAPFWVDVTGALRLVRAQHHLKSNEVGRLELGARVAVLEKRQSSDGAWRAAIALEGGGGKLFGWMTLMTRDGVENVTYVDPQPPVETLPPPLRSSSSSASLASSSGLQSGSFGSSFSARGVGSARGSPRPRDARLRADCGERTPRGGGVGGAVISRLEGLALTPRGLMPHMHSSR